MRKVSLSIGVMVGLLLVGCSGSDLSETSNSQADAGVEAAEGEVQAPPNRQIQKTIDLK